MRGKFNKTPIMSLPSKLEHASANKTPIMKNVAWSLQNLYVLG
jgi:hypothetical protein